MVTTPPQQFCVRWNSYQTNLQNAFPKLLVSEHFVDVTLACENDMLKCHKVVLSACSTYFEKLLLDNPCQHPIIFMKDMKFHEMQSLVDFMYKGEVNVTQDDLPSLLKSAEALQIRGLCGSDQLINSANFPCLKLPSTPTTPKTEMLNGKDTPLKTSTPNQTKSETPQQQQQQSQQQLGKINVKKDLTEQQQVHQQQQQQQHQQQEHHEGNPSSSDCDSNELPVQKDHEYVKEEMDPFYEGETEIMDTFLEEEGGTVNTTGVEDADKTEFAIANVSCQYDGTPGSASRRVRRSDEELRRAAECITRGQTFQTVSDQFNIPISTIRFYMARKGILPRRKRGRSCAGPTIGGSGNGPPIAIAPNYGNSGNTSPIGPPFHIVHYKLPPLGVSPKLK